MRLLLILLPLICAKAVAQVTLPNDLQPNTKASASKVMENFNALKDGVNTNATAIQNLDSNGVTASQLRGLITVVEETEACKSTPELIPLGCTAVCPEDKIAIGGGCHLFANVAMGSSAKIVRSGIYDNEFELQDGTVYEGSSPELVGKAYYCMANGSDLVRKVQAVCL